MSNTGSLKEANAMKTSKGPRFLVYVAVGYLLTFGLLTTLVLFGASMFGTDSGEIASLVLVLGGLALFFGWIPGAFTWLIVWGIRGWIGLGFVAKDAFTQIKRGREEARIEEQERLAAAEQAILAGNDTDYPVARPNDDPWNGTNPFGCCQTNYDEQGRLHHGSPDCRHPLVLEARAMGQEAFQ